MPTRRKKRKVDDAVVVEPTFKDFVDKVLILRDGSDLLKFRLRMWCSYPIDTWIRYAIWHNVREVDLHLSVAFQFPHYVFTSRSLQVLKLTGAPLQLPAGTGFRNLKALHLFGVYVFVSQEMGFEFLSHCPLLEYLQIDECYPKGLNILGLILKTLILRKCSSDIKIRVSAPCLQTFKYTGSVPKDFDGENLFSLAHAVLDFQYKPWNYIHSTKESTGEKERMCVSKLIQWISKAEGISPYITSFMLLSFEWPLDHLKKVEITDFGGSEDELKLLKFLLQRAKILERMVIFTSKPGRSDSEKQTFVRKLMAFPRAFSCITMMLSLYSISLVVATSISAFVI